MCGIAGVLHSAGRAREELERAAAAMADSLAHRGPDDSGVWSDAEAGVALSHRRLSIIDLSPTGHQPMVSAEGRFVVVFNGEIYNYQELRAELAARGVTFRGASDTEVMLEAFAAFGIAATVQRLIGMFTLGIWDRRERALTLVRDRLGIKPLYWAKFGSLFLFGSELRALRAHPGWDARVDRAALAAYMRLSYVPAPFSIYEGVRRLEPGTILTLPWGGEPKIERFWDARAVAKAGLADPLRADDAELTDRLEDLLRDAVKRRMVADVPVGAFLSGGVDSSTVAALMKAANAGPVRTYSIGFETADYSEARDAAQVARHLGTEHSEMTVTAQDALAVIPRLPEIYDEPFADASQIPTYLVSVMTRRHVTVALSGDGGDELFAGYNRHRLTASAWRTLHLLPRPVRAALARSITAVSAERWSQVASLIPERMRPRQAGDKLHKFAATLPSVDASELYRRLVTHWEPEEVMPGAGEAKGVLWDARIDKDFPAALDRMQYLDLVTYLPDDILTKVDRASMAVALEVRVPLIDHRVVEFAWRLPRAALLRGGVSKWLLRQVLYRHVPQALVERPKSGFAVPLGDWLRGPLRSWAENLLAEPRLRQAGFFDAARVRQTWSEHLSGRRNLESLLWSVLMFEAWRERWSH
jgi:asparagine synthase (glutamine-hydrolysing)